MAWGAGACRLAPQVARAAWLRSCPVFWLPGWSRLCAVSSFLSQRCFQRCHQSVSSAWTGHTISDQNQWRLFNWTGGFSARPVNKGGFVSARTHHAAHRPRQCHGCSVQSDLQQRSTERLLGNGRRRSDPQFRTLFLRVSWKVREGNRATPHANALLPAQMGRSCWFTRRRHDHW